MPERPAPLTGALVARVFLTSGLRLLVQRDDVFIAERAIPGEPLVLRRFTAQLIGPGRWKVGHLFRSGLAHQLTHSRAVLDVEELEAFVGGCCSVPYSRTEVRAIEQGLAFA